MYVNLTPHLIRLNSGEEISPSGYVARVDSKYQVVAPNFYKVVFGQVVGLPPTDGISVFIVSGMVASAVKRSDVVAPATGHPDCIRKDGQVYSVPGFIIS